MPGRPSNPPTLPAAALHAALAALAAATSGRPVPVPRTAAVGCPIPGLTAAGRGADAR